MSEYYYPHRDWQEKQECYKKAVASALSAACHPDHLSNVRRKLDYLEKVWRKELNLTKEIKDAAKTQK